MQKKLVVLYFLVLLAFAGLSARLVLINRDNGEQYKRQVLSQQQYSSRTLPFKRGEILDSKGTKLAVSEKVYNLVLDCKLMNEKEEYVEGTIAALTQCFDVSESDIRSYNEQNPTSQYHVLKRQLTYDEIAPFQELQNNEEQGKYIQGVWFEEEYRRVYPNNTMAADVVGFTSKDNVGNYGLEEYYNDILSGINGREYGYMNDDSNLERTTKAAVDGYNLVTTLDANIQGIVERKLQEYNDTYKNAAREGSRRQLHGAHAVLCKYQGGCTGFPCQINVGLQAEIEILHIFQQCGFPYGLPHFHQGYVAGTFNGSFHRHQTVSACPVAMAFNRLLPFHNGQASVALIGLISRQLAAFQSRRNNQYVVSFIGYAPADDPRIAIYVVVDRPNSDKQDDAKYATRIVKSVLTEVLPYMDIFMTEPLSEAEQKDLEEQQIAYKQQLMSQVSGNDVSENDVGGEEGEDQEGGQAGEGSQSGEGTGNEEDNVNRPAMEIDPETGYGILPDGTRVDPKTGDAIDEDTPLDLPEPNLPLNDGQNQGDESGDNSPF